MEGLLNYHQCGNPLPAFLVTEVDNLHVSLSDYFSTVSCILLIYNRPAFRVESTFPSSPHVIFTATIKTQASVKHDTFTSLTDRAAKA